MRSITLAIFILISFTKLNSQTNNLVNDTRNKQLEITGNIKGLKEGETAYLKLIEGMEYGAGPVVDSARVTNGIFNLKSYVQNGPRLFWIGFSQHPHLIATTFDNETVSITYDKTLDSLNDQSAFQYLQIGGSQSAKQFLYTSYAIKNSWYLAKGKIEIAINKFRDSALTTENLVFLSGLLKARDLVSAGIGQMLTELPVHEVVPEFFAFNFEEFKRDSIFNFAYNRLNDKIKNSYFGQLVKDQLYLCMGQPAPDFSFNMANNKVSSLKDVIAKNKLTILHFWSNNSLDRKRIHNDIANAYKKYNSKGLQIVSVSFDANKDKWKRVIEEDRIPGIQFCDFKEEESPISRLYKMNPKNTVNILIDQNGKMIAYDVDGPALFGYLYRIFGE